jgi:hypothetical protein
MMMILHTYLSSMYCCTSLFCLSAPSNAEKKLCLDRKYSIESLNLLSIHTHCLESKHNVTKVKVFKRP